MSGENSNIQDLIIRYLRGELNESELRELEQWKNQASSREELLSTLTSEGYLQDELTKLYLVDEHVQSQLRAAGYGADEVSSNAPVRRIHFLRHWGWAAASILIVLLAGTYLWTINKKNTEPPAVATETVDIPPGKNGAVLTLADGTQVALDSLGDGVIATQKGAQVLLKHGGLSYAPGESASDAPVYNTVNTPKGRQFRITLPDGTQVWLNSASSIRYPTEFAGNERKITVTGEAYFEVVKNAQKPFKVNVNNHAEVEVLGTHFNVNAYNNEESITTTLLEGSVKVAMSASPDRPAVTLKPGQQGQIPVAQKTQEGVVVINNADIDMVMAWKNGLFNFKGLKLEEVMRQLERWYDIEVVYEGAVPDIKLKGEMTRGVTLNGLLTGLQEFGVHCKLEGRKLIVLP